MRAPLLYGALTSVLLIAGCISLLLGPADLPIPVMLSALFGDGAPQAVAIMQELRLPRTLLAAMVGGVLGLAGAALQGLLRNPLAEPGVIGISASAGFGAVLAIYIGWAATSSLATPVLAMATALVATTILIAIALRDASTLTLILSGVAISSLAVALTSLAMNLSSNPWAVSEMVFWLLGSVKDRSMADIALAGPFMLIGGLLLIFTGRSLDALSLGEDAARSMGVALNRLRAQIILGTALAVGASVAVTGSVGFVGLVVPHLLRPLTDRRPSQLLLPSALGGAVLVLLADSAIRAVTLADPAVPELHLGVVTSLIGAPFFLYLIMATRRTMR